MARTTATFSVSLPPEMAVELEELMKVEHRARSELVREALRRYFRERRVPRMMSSEQTRPKAHIRNGELTIPLSEKIRGKLDVHDGDEMEAHVFKGTVSFTPKSADTRERAWKRIFSIIDKVQLRPGQTPMTEEEIVEAVHAVRRARRARPRHDYRPK